MRLERAAKILLVIQMIVPVSAPSPQVVCDFWKNVEIRNQCGGCGFCLYYGRLHQYLCDWTQQDYSYYEENQCKVINHCNTGGMCKASKCLPMFGTFKCECDKNSFGRLCQFQKLQGIPDSHYADIADIIIDPLASYGIPITMAIFFKNLGNNVLVATHSDREHYLFNSEICEAVVIAEYCTRYFGSYPQMCKDNPNLYGKIQCVMTIKFITQHLGNRGPYINFHTDPPEPEFRIAQKGFVTVEVFNYLGTDSSYPIFHFTYNYIVLYVTPYMFECEPWVELHNLGQTMYNQSVVNFAMKDTIIITSTVKPKSVERRPNCAGSSNYLLHWKVFKLGYNFNEFLQKPFKEVFKEAKISFQPFSLEIGLYKVTLNVTCWTGNLISFDFVGGFFQVIELNLEAVITGGEERSIYYNEKSLKLYGDRSRNPNVHPSKHQGSLYFYWRCNRTDLAFCKEKRSDYNIIYPGPFLQNEHYMFYLTVRSVANERLEDTTTQIIFMSPADQYPVELLCRKNCGWGGFQSNPDVVIYFEAVVVGIASDSVSFEWTYSRGSTNDYQSVSKIRQSKTPSNILIVLEQTLSAGEDYTFRAKGAGKGVGEAKFHVKMAKTLSNVSCGLVPMLKNISIIRGVTRVQVNCTTPKYNHFAPIYDVYDLYSGKSGSGTILISSSRSNQESEIILSGGGLVVEVTDEYGMISQTELLVKLTESNDTKKVIIDLLESLKQSQFGLTLDASFKTNTVSVIYDLMVSDNHTFSDITEYMLSVIADIEIDDIPVLKVVTSLLNRIASEDLNKSLSMNSLNYISKSVKHLSGKLLSEIKEHVNLTDISELTISEIRKVCTNLLQICDIIHVDASADVTKKVMNKQDTQDYYSSYRESSGSMVRTVRHIMSCFSLITLPYELPVIVEKGHIKIWLKEDTPEAFCESGYEPVPSVVVSESLAKSASKVSKFVVMQVAQFDGNPYSYNQQFKIYSSAVDLRILFKLERNELRIIDISNPVLISLQHLGTERTVVNGLVCQPDSQKSVDVADIQVDVHQLRIPQRGTLDLKFLGLEDGQAFRVKVLFNKRPDYEFMADDDVLHITKSSPNLSVDLKAPQSHDLYDLYYVGVLPGSDVPTGHCINYSLEITTLHCVSWKFHEWSTGDCEVKGTTESYELQCECRVFSTFAGFPQIPLNKHDDFEECKLLLTETNNPFVLILLALLLLSALLLFILACWKDSSNVKGKVIYLEDNFPGDKFSYLVAVFTGSKFFGGTTSNVGIMIEGEKSCSRPHILRSSWCRTLRKGEDDWFLMSTISHLGNLKMIHLWMDYSGRSPEWYCYKIVVIDMLSHKQYLFLVDAWLSLRGKNFVERFVKVTKNENDKRLYLVVDDLIFGLRDTHLWLGVCFGHPRSIVSRAQRLIAAFNQLLIIMLLSCLFLTVLEQRSEDYPYYKLTVDVLLISVVSIVISSIFVNILMSVFRKTFLFKLQDHKKNEQKEGNIALKNNKHKSTNFLFRCCEDFLKVFTNRKKFKPVILQFDKKGINRKQIKYSLCCLKIGWLVAVVVMIISFILLCYFSRRMGKVKTLVWLTCIVISLFLVLFLIAPLRILGLAVLSGLFYYNINQVVSYHIRTHLLSKYKRGLMDSKRHLVSKLVSMRRHSCYVPLTYKRIMKKLHKQRKFDATLLLLDMFLIGVLLVLLFMQNESLWSTKYYWNNKQLRSLLRQGYKEEGVQLYSLTDLSQYSLFLEKSVFPVTYQSRWYNKQPIIDGNSTSERFVFGGTSKLFGLPRLRQKRLKPDVCEKPIYENLSRYCNVKLTEDTEDINLYAEGWVETGPHKMFPKVSPWNHMSDTETYDTTLFGYSNTAYKGDGYVAELEMTEEKAEDIVLTLYREKWLDRRTGVVIFELTLYNAFSGTFSWLIAVTENLHIGLLMNRVYVFTVSDSYNFPIIDLVFLAGLLMFTVRVFFVVNKNGIDDFADDFWNMFEMIMVCLGIICATLFILNINSKFNYFKSSFIGDTREKYFEYLHLLQYLDSFRIVLSVLAVMLVCRFMKSWRFGDRIYILFKTLSFSWVVLAVMFVVLLSSSCLYWAIFSYMINDFMISKHYFPVTSKIDFKHIVKSCNTISCKIGPFVLCCISLLVQLVIVFLFLTSFRIVKRKTIEIPPLNFATVFFERFKKYLLEVKYKGKKRLLKF